MSWTRMLPSYPGYWWWRDRSHPATETPVLMKTVLSATLTDASGIRYQRLLAGPWSGGLEFVGDMGGEWQAGKDCGQ